MKEMAERIATLMASEMQLAARLETSELSAKITATELMAQEHAMEMQFRLRFSELQGEHRRQHTEAAATIASLRHQVRLHEMMEPPVTGLGHRRA